MPLFERTNTLPPGANSEDWATYFREYRKGMDLVKRGITDQYLDEDGMLVVETIEEPPAYEVRGVVDVDPLTLVRSPKSVYDKIASMSWSLVALRRSTLWYFDHFQKADGKVKANGDQVLAGDLTKAEHEETRLYMTVVSQQYKTGFEASWNGGSFTEVVMHDVPVGFPVPIYRTVRGLNEKGEGKTVYLDDGESFITHRLWTDKMAMLNEWLDDWLAIINPEAE